jgi:PAS domain S-box-containing protein
LTDFKHRATASRWRTTGLVGAAAAVLIVGVLLAGWALLRSDRLMRENLLQQTQIVAQMVDIDQVRALSGSEKDLGTPEYLALKGQLAQALQANERYRFVYLMGRRDDGRLVFFVDDRPVGHDEEAPAGMVYDDAPAGFLRVMETGAAAVEGPFRDSWGAFVSGCVPLMDEETGEILAILAVDFDARTWMWDVIAGAALPLALVLLLAIGAITAMLTLWRMDASLMPVRRRLLLPLAAVLLVLVGGFGALLMTQHTERLNESSRQVLFDVANDLPQALEDQARALVAIEGVLVQDDELRQALQSQDQQRLLTEAAPLFASLQAEHGITHFYFISPERVCLLRVHKPEKCDDRIDRFTALEAERTGGTASGIELGPLGTFTLRVVRPVFEGETLIGYVELGKEIEDILSGLHESPGVELAVIIRKKALDREAWESGMAMLGREADWDRFEKDVLIYSSLSPFPDAAGPLVGVGNHLHGEPATEMTFNNGRWRVMVFPVADASGAMIGDLLVMHDISQQKAAQSRLMVMGEMGALVLLAGLFGFLFVLLGRTDASIEAQQAEMQAQEEQYRLLVQGSPNCISLFDREGCFESINQNGLAAMGWSEQDVLGRRFAEIWPEDARPMVEAALAQVLQGEKASFEADFQRADGSMLTWWVVLSPMVEADGSVRRFVGIATDVTERKENEESLRQSREQFMLAVRGTNDGIWDWDLRDNSLFLSPKWKEQLGYADDELENTFVSFEGNLHPDDRPRVMEYVEQYLTGQVQQYNMEFRMRHKDGSYRWILARGEAVRDEEGIPYRMAGSHTDITERKEAEEVMLETNRQLEEATARANEMAVQAEIASVAKSEFLANMSHEIRTPMNGIIGMTALLLGTELDEAQRRYAEIVRSSGQALLSLINDILDFSKIEAGKLDLEMLDYDLVSLLDEFAAALALKAEEKGLELICAVDPAAPTLLRGDPGRVRQLLTNLVGNSIKFTHEGEVAVCVSVESEAEDSVMLRFSVRDTGIGIPLDKQGLLFDKFSQVDASSTRQYGGTGLGLAISKQLAGLMGGGVGVESAEGMGSEFWFTARFEKQAQQTQAESAAPIEGCGARVLIVDDNATNREMLHTRLAAWDMRPAVVEDGPEALRTLSQAAREGDPFRLALIDMHMPRMDGETLGRAILADKRLADVRIVLMSPLGTGEDTLTWADHGFAGCLTKPVRQRELRDLLVQVLGRGDEPFPRYVSASSPGSDGKVLNRFVGSTARILLVEDNIINQQVALGILKKLGFSRIDSAANGVEALAALAAASYDVVLMDVQMPVMDGLEATRRIRCPESEVRNREIPIIAMTAHALTGDREWCIDAGMNDYAPKPVSPQVLAQVLARWLPTEALRAQADGHADDVDTNEYLPTFDRQGLLDRLLNDDALADRVLEAFLEDFPRQLRMIKESFDQRDMQTCRRYAHTLKGAAGSVGALALHKTCAEIEEGARQCEGDVVARRIPLAEMQFERLQALIADRVPN